MNVDVFPVWGLVCPVFLLLMMFVAGVIIRLAMTRPTRSTSSTGMVVTIVSLAVAGVVVLLSVIGSHSQTIVATPATIVADATNVEIQPDTAKIATIQLPSPPADWNDVDQSSFVADVYPTMLEASAPLARQIIAALQTNRLLPAAGNEGAKPPQTITLFTDKLAKPDSADVTQRLLAELRLQFPDATISLQIPSVALSNNQVFGNAIALLLSNQQELQSPSPWDRADTLHSGKLQCEAITSLGRTVASVKYLDKPWVESFDRFAGERPSKQFIAGYSASLAASPIEAQQAALRDANEKLGRAGHHQFQLVTSAAADQFLQKLSRPYGDVWRAAYLFDLSSPVVANLLVDATRVRTTASVKKMTATFAIGILFAMTAVMCVVLNWLTLGYYRNQVGIGWAVMGLVVLSVLIMSS